MWVKLSFETEMWLGIPAHSLPSCGIWYKAVCSVRPKFKANIMGCLDIQRNREGFQWPTQMAPLTLLLG